MSTSTRPVVSFWSGDCPAKLNLRLAVTGRRDDGFHDLISLVTRLSWADRLELEWFPEGEGEQLEVSGEDLVADDTNLVLRAIRSYRQAAPFPGSIHARLVKRIPIGAGLGGGSSDAATTLQGLQVLWSEALGERELRRIACQLGADVPFFLGPSPAIMRGIGDRLEPVEAWRETLRPWHVAVFKPFFGISTLWAYGQLANAGIWTDEDGEEALYRSWRTNGLAVPALIKNDFCRVVDRRFPTVPVLLARLNRLPRVQAGMSGSGSACFALYEEESSLAEIRSEVVHAWGSEAFFAACSIR